MSVLSKTFPALKHRNYRYYFVGQFISMVGSWLQNIAYGWLVLELTKSAFWVGAVATFNTLPVLLFSLFAGTLADRFSKRLILIITQITAMIFAFLLGVLTITETVNVLIISIIAFITGLVNTIDIPARQAFVVEMVGKEDLQSAIALNSGVFNTARVLGPALAGVLIATIGIGGAFIVNAVSFIASIIALWLIRPIYVPDKPNTSVLRSIKEAIFYSIRTKVLRILLFYTAVASIFGWSFSSIMPVIAKDIFRQDAQGLSYLMVAIGLGAITGTVVISMLGKKVDEILFILVGNSLFVISMITLSFTTTLYGALPALFLIGLGLILQFVTINTVIQGIVDDEKRGRVMSIYMFMFLGLSPIGSFQMGYFAEQFGVWVPVRVGAAVILLYGIVLFYYKTRIQQSYVSNKNI